MRRFRSKIDLWLLGIVLAGLGLPCAILIAEILGPEPASGLGLVVALLLAGLLFVIWTWTTTDYTLAPGELLIRSGPFHWRVPLAEILAVTPTRNPLSSPALSLDRLEVRYGRMSLLLISPEDKDGFLSGLVAQAPHLVRRGDRVVRLG